MFYSFHNVHFVLPLLNYSQVFYLLIGYRNRLFLCWFVSCGLAKLTSSSTSVGFAVGCCLAPAVCTRMLSSISYSCLTPLAGPSRDWSQAWTSVTALHLTGVSSLSVRCITSMDLSWHDFLLGSYGHSWEEVVESSLLIVCLGSLHPYSWDTLLDFLELVCLFVCLPVFGIGVHH